MAAQQEAAQGVRATPRSAACGRAACLVVLVLGAATVAPIAHAQVLAPPAGAAQRFDIAPGPLAPAVTRFAADAGVAISFDAARLQGLTTTGLQGSYTVERGFAQLLRGSGWEAEHRGGGNYALRPAPPPPAPAPTPAASGGTLPVVTVTAAPDVPDPAGRRYAGNQVARGVRLGQLGERDMMDTPFNVTTITSETIQNQQARNVGDVVKNDPSVRTIWPDGSYISQFTIRGLPTQTQDMSINGVYGLVPPQMTGGLEFFDRVEILKGPTALLYGMAPTGGVGGNINLVTKRAPDVPITQLTASWWSDAQFGGHVDIGRRFGDDNRWGIRLNGAYRDGRTGVDDQSQRAGAASVALDYRDPRLRLALDAGYHDMHTDAPTRVSFTDNANFQIPAAPRGTLSLGQTWYFAKSKDSFGLISGEYDVNDRLTLTAAAGTRSNEFLGLYNFIYLQNAGGAFRANQYYQPTFSDTRTMQAGVRGRFATGAVRHEVSLSASALNTQSGVLAPVISTYVSNLNNLASLPPPNLAPYSSSAPRTSESDLDSVALSDTLKLLEDRLQVTLGLRRQSVKVTNFSAATGATTSNYDQSRVTPAVALAWRPDSGLTFYGNYIEGLSQGPTAPTGTVNVGTAFAPIRSRQYEVGAKRDFGRFAATLSLFQIEQPSGITSSATNVFSVDGEQRHRGIEFNVFGEPVRRVRMLGGITLMQGRLTRTANGTYDGNKPVGVPDTQFNLGAEWDPAAVPGLTVTGRLIYTSSQFYNVANSQSIPSWTRVDAGVRFATRLGGTPVTLRAGVENLLGRDYWAAASTNFGLARGAPRTVLVSATFEF